MKTTKLEEKRTLFTEEEVRIAHLMGWHAALTSASTSPRMNRPQREILQALCYPKILELEGLGIHPEGGRDNSLNNDYYEWVDAQ